MAADPLRMSAVRADAEFLDAIAAGHTPDGYDGDRLARLLLDARAAAYDRPLPVGWRIDDAMDAVLKASIPPQRRNESAAAGPCGDRPGSDNQPPGDESPTDRMPRVSRRRTVVLADARRAADRPRVSAEYRAWLNSPWPDEAEGEPLPSRPVWPAWLVSAGCLLLALVWLAVVLL